MIRIDVTRDDGEVTRLEGVAGLAVMLPTGKLPVAGPLDPVELMLAVGKDMPVVSLRANTGAELAVMVGALLATIRDEHPEVLECVAEITKYVQTVQPAWRRWLP